MSLILHVGMKEMSETCNVLAPEAGDAHIAGARVDCHLGHVESCRTNRNF